MASAAAKPIVNCIRRIRAPLDHLIMQPTDLDQVTTGIRTVDAAMVTFYVPQWQIQRKLHKRYEAEAFGEYLPSENCKDEEKIPLALVTIIAGRNIPSKQTTLERWIDPAPHNTLSVRVSVMDRVHWNRTSWLAGSICRSLCWGRIPQRIFSINLDYTNSVEIDAKFDPKLGIYPEPYTLAVPGLDFSLQLQDTGKTLFDPTTGIVEGFLDNESALHQLTLAREVNMEGLGGSVYRQTLWSSPSLPNVAKVVNFNPGTLFKRYFDCDPIGEPVAVWMVDEVEKTHIYSMEGEVEDENDPNSATTYGDRSLTERVQKKAMNRYNSFRDEIRGKAYSDIDGREIPR